MQKTLSILFRLSLVAGVLVALTPCGVCQKHSPMASAKASQSCCAGTQTNDCGSPSASPFCEIMDQSSVSVSPVQVDAAAVPVISVVSSTPSVLTVAAVPSAVSVFVSPPRGPLPLRI